MNRTLHFEESKASRRVRPEDSARNLPPSFDRVALTICGKTLA